MQTHPYPSINTTQLYIQECYLCSFLCITLLHHFGCFCFQGFLSPLLSVSLSSLLLLVSEFPHPIALPSLCTGKTIVNLLHSYFQDPTAPPWALRNIPISLLCSPALCPSSELFPDPYPAMFIILFCFYNPDLCLSFYVFSFSGI